MLTAEAVASMPMSSSAVMAWPLVELRGMVLATKEGCLRASSTYSHQHTTTSGWPLFSELAAELHDNTSSSGKIKRDTCVPGL